MPEPIVTEATRDGFGPTKEARRIVALDVLRGFAILGILLVNVMDFGGVATRSAGAGGVLDRAVDAFLAYGARGAFMSTFAMLFGLGFALQIARLGRAGDGRGYGFYLRRMAALLAFGLLHTLLDPAEVLVLYALCGALLLFFRQVPSRALVLVALVLMPLPYLHTAVVTAQAATNPAVETSSFDEDPRAWDPYGSAESIRVHSEGSFADIVGFNFRFTLNRLTPSLASYVWMTVPLPLMLVGMLVGRLGLLADVQAHRRWLARAFWAGVVGGIVGRSVGQTLFDLASRGGWNPWTNMGGQTAWVLGAFFLAVAYCAALLLLLQVEPWRRVLLPLRFVGRMALTNYLLQTAICTTLFYEYGAALFGKVSSSAAASIAVGIFAFQLAASAVWLGRYRFGPAEWLWRSLTYGKVISNRRLAHEV